MAVRFANGMVDVSEMMAPAEQTALVRRAIALRASSCCEVRAGMHRLLRYLALARVPLSLMARYDLDFAIVRSLELNAPNVIVEKRQAMHLLRVWLQKDCGTFPDSLGEP